MKITETLFQCDWCLNKQEHIMNPNQGHNPIKSHGQIICEKCPGNRHISQKTYLEMKA